MLVRRIAGLLGAAIAISGAMAIAAPAAQATCVGPYPSPGADPSVGACVAVNPAYNPDPDSLGVNGVCFLVEVWVVLGNPGNPEYHAVRGGTGAVELESSPLYTPCPTSIT